MDPSEQQVRKEPAAADQFASRVEAFKTQVSSLVQRSGQLAQTESPETEASGGANRDGGEDWQVLSKLLNAFEQARHEILDFRFQVWQHAMDEPWTNPAGPAEGEIRRKWSKARRIGDQLSPLLQRLEVAGNIVRPVFDRAIRPFMRPLNILDLPDELLREIFAHAKGKDPLKSELWFIFELHPTGGVSVQNVQNIRLTCRRFCGASSHLLLDFVDVALDRASLAHLDEISRHPTISKGIMAMRVSVDFYSSSGPDDTHFVQAALHQLERNLSFYRHELDSWGASDSLMAYHKTYTLEEFEGMIHRSERTYRDWLAYLSQPLEPADEQARRNVAAVRRGFEEYEELAREQADVLKDGAFAKAIAEAMARMPTATRLMIMDNRHYRSSMKWPPPRGPTPIDMANDPYLFVRDRMLDTSSWASVDSDETEGPPLALLHQLPLEIMKAGATLASFEIHASVRSVADLEQHLSQHDISGLTPIARSLKVFDYRGSGVPEDADIQPTKFLAYLRLLTTGQKLQRLSIHINPSREEYIPMGFLLTPKPPLGLRICDLDRCAFHLHELKRFLGPFRPKSLYIAWRDTRLLSGTWAEALEIIRETADGESILTDAYGAECDSMPREEADAIFGRGPPPAYENSKATKYIRGFRHYGGHNPLLPAAVEPGANEGNAVEEE